MANLTEPRDTRELITAGGDVPGKPKVRRRGAPRCALNFADPGCTLPES